VISCDTRNFKVIFGYCSKIKQDGDIRDREDEKKKMEVELCLVMIYKTT
jgi:hypothetical protein